MTTAPTTYALRLSDDELGRYRMMAARARDEEGDMWALAGLVPGARVADIGCGPGALLVTLAEVVGPTGHVVGVDADRGLPGAPDLHAATCGGTSTRATTRASAAGWPTWGGPQDWPSRSTAAGPSEVRRRAACGARRGRRATNWSAPGSPPPPTSPGGTRRSPALDASAERPELTLDIFAAVCRRPA